MSELRANAENMIDKFVAEIGLTKDQTYNAQNRAWYWKKGSAGVEVFIQEIPVGDYTREFLRIFSKVMTVPEGKEKELYQRLLEMNDSYLGLKLTIQPGTKNVYATYERDIVGLDYEELKTCILDLEWWADEIDDILIEEFGGSK